MAVNYTAVACAMMRPLFSVHLTNHGVHYRLISEVHVAVILHARGQPGKEERENNVTETRQHALIFPAA